jgi:hypothetical protein
MRVHFADAVQRRERLALVERRKPRKSMVQAALLRNGNRGAPARDGVQNPQAGIDEGRGGLVEEETRQ